MPGHQDRDHERATYEEATIRTSANLKTIATRSDFRELSSLSLPEIDWLSDEIARVVPAGNVPGLILNGLLHMNGRHIHEQEAQKHIDLLFRGVKQTLNRAVFGAFFVGPASILYGYQLLLKLAGKSPEDAFPEGTWQYYLEFALREDSARHANETTGFHNHITTQHPQLPQADLLAAWLLATAHIIRQNHAMIANEWRERVMLRLMGEIAARHHPRKKEAFDNLPALWAKQKPYQRSGRADGPDFTIVRRDAFNTFCEPLLKRFKHRARQELDAAFQALERQALNPYIQQMSWLAHLRPDAHRETRIHYHLEQAQLGIIYDEAYTLVNVTDLFEVNTARATAKAILNQPAPSPARLDDLLVDVPRGSQAALRAACDPEAQSMIAAMQKVPIFINWDEGRSDIPLARVRRRKRAFGDHPLTIMRTETSIVFDQSHIFFDGIWGAAVAEIITNEARLWATFIADLPPVRPTQRSLQRPALPASPAVVRIAAESPRQVEANAETTAVDLQRILTLRQVLKQRSESARVTVNDLLILYRSLHPSQYQPSPGLRAELERLGQDKRSSVRDTYKAVNRAIQIAQTKNPSILIPIDASAYSPRDRVLPTTFRNPMTNVLGYHQEAINTLRRFHETGSRADFQAFEAARLTYLRILGGFGELLSAYKDIALTGNSASITTLKFLAHLPSPMQRLLNEIPNRFTVLNEIIKGEEVFSNIGRVAEASSLRRFITAKDDNTQKTFAWGLITDNSHTLHITLRDFRPHNALLMQAGYLHLGDLIAQDYLDNYASGLNRFVTELHQITMAGPRGSAGRR